jgi:hypothetical protein
MRPVTICRAFALSALLVASCAHEKPSSAPGMGGTDTQVTIIDSLEETAYDDLFTENHSLLIKEIGAREREGMPEARLIEARSLVSASEELYLRGMGDAALRLLEEASRTLKQKR